MSVVAASGFSMSEPAGSATFSAVIPSTRGPVDALLAIGEHGVSLATANAVLGTWSLEQCRVSAVEGDLFQLEAEGESLTFVGENPEGLAGWVSRIWDSPVELGPQAEPEPEPEDTLSEEAPSLSELIAQVAARRPQLVETLPAPSTESGDEQQLAEPGVSEFVTALTGFLARIHLPKPGLLLEKVKQNRRVGVAAGLGGLLLVLVAVWGLFGPEGQAAAPPIEVKGDQATETTIGSLPVSPATTAPSTTIAHHKDLLDSTPRQFAARWNQVVADLDDTLFLRAEGGARWDLAPYLSLAATTDPFSGMIQSVSVTAAPQGQAEADRAIMVSLGAVIGAAEPALDPFGRRGLIEALGLDVNRPDLAGLDNIRTYGRLAYHLIYRPDSGELQLTIAAVGSCFERLPGNIEDPAIEASADQQTSTEQGLVGSSPSNCQPSA
jgi:hypothetical protein